MELLSSINNSGIGAQYAVSAAKDVNGNEITSTYLTAVPEGYATESFVTSQGYITGSYLTADALDNVSSTWNTVTNKLDSTAFSTVSGNFLTAHQSLPSSANWNSTYNTVTGNSAKWNDTYDTVHDNSASWTGGGASVTSPRGTINVNGDEIEGTNSAVLTGTAGGYETYLLANNSYIRPDPDVLINSTTTFPQTGGTLVIPVQYGDTALYITITGNTNDGAATASGQLNTAENRVYIPLGEMNGPFTAQASYWANLSTITLTASAAPTTGITGVGELAWNSALDSIRNTSAAWNNTYSTVVINSASWAEGTEYSAGSGIDITDDVISLTNPLTLVPSGDVTIDVTGNSAVISVNAGTSYTGDAQGALDEVYTNSGNWNTVTDKLNTTAFSTVSGNFLTAHQALPNSGNWDSTYTTVSTNSADWNSAAAMNELPVSAGEGMDIQNVDGNIVFSCTGGSVPEGVLVESGLEYNANNEISGYSGSAFAQPSISAAEWNSNYETVNTNSGTWGGAALPISAGPGVKVELTDGKLLFSTDETVLYDGVQTFSATLNESIKNFDKILIEYGPSNYFNAPAAMFFTDKFSADDALRGVHLDFVEHNGANAYCFPKSQTFKWNSTFDQLDAVGGLQYRVSGNAIQNELTGNQLYIRKVVGINRTAGGN